MKSDDKTNFLNPTELQHNRIENTFRASVIGLLGTLLTTVVPFLIRMMMMWYMGEEYVGLNSVLQSIVWILNTTELGIGQVMVFFLYKPAAMGDIERINAYLNEIRHLYRIVAIIILVGGLTLIPFLKFLVKGDISLGENMYFVYIEYLLALVFQYLIWPEMSSVLAAYQRLDVQYVIVVSVHIAVYAFQIVTICILKSLEIYVFIVLVQAIITGAIQKWVCHKLFKGCIPSGRIPTNERKDIRNRIVSMIGHQMDEKVLANVDNLFISSFLGLGMVAIYGNYFYVITAVSIIINTVYNSVLSSIGNAMVVESKESNRVRFDCMSFLSSFLAGWSTACMLCMYQTFMELWMPGHLLPMGIVVLFCVYSYIAQMRRTVQTFKNAGGMWQNDKFKPYVSILLDLVLNFVLIKWIGLKGAIISTIICVGIVEYPWESYVLFRDYFYGGYIEHLISTIHMSLVNTVMIAICTMLCCFFYPKILMLRLILEFIISSLVMVISYIILFRRNKVFIIWMDIVKGIVLKRFMQ